MQFPTFLTREQIETSIGTLKSRFPIPSLIVLVLTGYIWYRIFLSDIYIQWEEVRIFTTVTSLILTFFLSLGLTIYREQKELKNTYAWVITSLFPLIYGGLYYWSFAYRASFEVQSATFFLLHMVGFLSCIFFTPFIIKGKKDSRNIQYSNYFTHVSWTLLMSVITGVALFILGSIALWSIQALFDFRDFTHYDKLYGYWATFALALIAPYYALSHFPRAEKIEEKNYESNAFFVFLIKYVMTPFVFIYFLILYVYSIKVLINFSDWPKGIISWLVIGFSTLGYITYIYAKPQGESVRYVAIFRTYFPILVLPQILMLAYAIYLRINQYGLTMNRYFVVAFGLWLTGISLYYTFSNRKNLIAIPLSLALISLSISIGPWSVFSLPYQDQYNKLIQHLTEAKILQNNTIMPLAKGDDISRELSNSIASEIEYLCDFNNCEGIKKLFRVQTAKIEEKSLKDWKNEIHQTWAIYREANIYQITQGIKEEIKVQRYYGEVYGTPEEPYFYYNTMSKTYPFWAPLDIRGYSKLITIYSIDQWNSVQDYIGDRIRVDIPKHELIYETSSGNITLPFTLPASFLDGTHAREVTQEEMIFNTSKNGITLKLYIQNIALPNPAYTGKTSYFPSVSGFALVK